MLNTIHLWLHKSRCEEGKWGCGNLDLIVRHATIIDGSGQSRFVGDVGIRGDRIAAVGQLADVNAAAEIDATGKVLAPGFIDVHSHGELALLGGRDQFAFVAQGITTLFAGNDGFGWAPLSPAKLQAMRAYLRFIYADPPLGWDWPSVEAFLDQYTGRTPTNVVPQTPFGTIRLEAMGWAKRPADRAEILAMQRLALPWFEAGAVSLCTGLEYQPQSWANTEELVELSRWAHAEFGARYVSHQRGYGAKGHIGFPETFRIGREAGIPVHISHMALFDEALPFVNEMGSTVDLSFDFYPYVAGSTHLAYMLPDWAQAGGLAAVMDRLRDPAMRAKILPHMAEALRTNARITISYTKSGRFEGRSLAEVAAESGQSIPEFVMDLILAEEQEALAVFHWGAAVGPAGEEIMLRTYRDPRQMVGSDGVYVGSHPHPRGFGTFPRVLARYVRELGALSLETAIYKMTGFPATRFGLKERGLIRPGMAADLVLLDAGTVADTATYEAPRQLPLGIEMVFVNGQAVWMDGKPTGRLPGRVVGRNR